MRWARGPCLLGVMGVMTGYDVAFGGRVPKKNTSGLSVHGTRVFQKIPIPHTILVPL